MMSEFIDELGGGYAILPRVIRKNTKLSNGAKLCYMAIVDYSFSSGFCFPSQDTIAEDMNVNRFTVSVLIRELREFGLVRVLQNYQASNTYVIVPVGRVDNLWRDEYIEVDREVQYITREQFDALVNEFKSFYSTMNEIAKDKKKKKSDTFADRVAKYNLLILEERYEEMKSADMCVGFALKFKDVFNEDYVVNWRTDSQTINMMLLKKGITGKDAIDILERFVSAYQSNFYSAEYPRPRIAYLKVDWIFRKLLGLTIAENESAQQQRRVDEMEVVGEW